METEEQNKDKVFHKDNITKSPFTSILGAIMMLMPLGTVGQQWFFGKELPTTYTVLAIFFGVGFMLLCMTDDIKVYLRLFISKKIDKI